MWRGPELALAIAAFMVLIDLSRVAVCCSEGVDEGEGGQNGEDDGGTELHFCVGWFVRRWELISDVHDERKTNLSKVYVAIVPALL